MGGFGWIDIFIQLERQLNKEMWIFPQRIWMVKVNMRLRTIFQKLCGNVLERLGGFRQTIKLKNIGEWFKHGLDSNSSRNDLEVFYLVNDIKS